MNCDAFIRRLVLDLNPYQVVPWIPPPVHLENSRISVETLTRGWRMMAHYLNAHGWTVCEYRLFLPTVSPRSLSLSDQIRIVLLRTAWDGRTTGIPKPEWFQSRPFYQQRLGTLLISFLQGLVHAVRSEPKPLSCATDNG